MNGPGRCVSDMRQRAGCQLGDLMIDINEKTNSVEEQWNGSAGWGVSGHSANDRDVPKHLERIASWLKVIRLLRGPLFWISVATVVVSVFAVALLSFFGWVPGSLGRIVMAVWMIFFWAAMMTAFAGWVLRSEK